MLGNAVNLRGPSGVSGGKHECCEMKPHARAELEPMQQCGEGDGGCAPACRMSDLAAPFLTVFEDDAMAFWCFERLMQRVRRNFRHDEAGIRRVPDSCLGASLEAPVGASLAAPVGAMHNS